MASEAIVRIRFWTSQDEYRDEYYAIDGDLLSTVEALIARDPNGSDAHAFIERHGRKLDPKVTVEVTEF